MIRLPASLSLLATLALAACDKNAGTDPSSLASSSGPVETNMPPQKNSPMLKEYTATSQDKLGVLPDGMGVAVGQSVPNFTASNIEGASTTLSALRQKHGAVLVAFYRGGWCPYCNFEIHALSKAFPEFERRSVTPVAVSVDTVDEASKTNATYEIPFPVLSDPELRAHEAFRVVHEASESEVKQLADFGIDIERSSGKSHHKFAVPSFFLIDAGGVVRWAHADPEYKVRPTVPQLLAAIDGAKMGEAQ